MNELILLGEERLFAVHANSNGSYESENDIEMLQEKNNALERQSAISHE
jgi:hypothetical protein